ncbi:T9SS type A sorting domain-containing protein [Flavobacterium ardleyense]|uniref:T9SS type A sorting domain-containing protein n=1 Tax=Flavobacterium ardleyense TaxID=2038737 RepID=A0ABW5ZBW9_9FLAO
MYQFLLTGNFYLPPTAALATDDFATSENAIKVYPNPSSSNFTVESPMNSNFKVMNAMGQLIQIAKDTSTFIINMESQATGIYFLEVNCNGTLQYKKLLLN